MLNQVLKFIGNPVLENKIKVIANWIIGYS